MDEPTRRAWSRPELIVLVRSGPEEAVLSACKYEGEPYSVCACYNSCLTKFPTECSNLCEDLVQS